MPAAEAPERFARLELDALITVGFYPALHDRPLDAADWQIGRAHV